MKIAQLIKRDVKLAFKKGSGALHSAVFFVIAVTLFPFALGSQPEILQQVGVGIIWVCALLSSQLSLGMLFEYDYEDGSLEQLFLQGMLPEVIVLGKVIAHWLVAAVPLILISPLLAMMLQLDNAVIQPLIISLAVGTFALSLLGAMGSAITLGSKKGGVLIPLLLLPLSIPILIFGVAAVTQGGALGMLAGLLLFFLPVSIVTGAVSIKMAIEYS